MVTLIRCPLRPVRPWWHVKDPGHPVKGASGRSNPNTHTPLTQRSRCGLTMLSRHSVETIRKKRAHSETLGHSRLSPMSHCGLILAKKKKKREKKLNWCARADLHFKKKKRRRGVNRQIFVYNPRKAKEKTTTTIARAGVRASAHPCCSPLCQ